MDSPQTSQDIPTEPGAEDLTISQSDGVDNTAMNENTSNPTEVQNIQTKKRVSRKAANRSTATNSKSTLKEDGVENTTMDENASHLAGGDSTKLKRKMAKKVPAHPPTSEMVMESIKALKMRRGASVDAIRQHIEATYDVNMKTVETHFKKFLKNGVEKGLLEQVTGAGDSHRFKIKKTESVKKDTRNLKESHKKEKIEKKSEAERKKRPIK